MRILGTHFYCGGHDFYMLTSSYKYVLFGIDKWQLTIEYIFSMVSSSVQPLSWCPIKIVEIISCNCLFYILFYKNTTCEKYKKKKLFKNREK